MQDVIKKWGNSAAVRIPFTVLDAAHMHLDQQVDVRAENGCIVIESLQPMHNDLDALIAGITDENRHDPVDMGPLAGKEAW